MGGPPKKEAHREAAVFRSMLSQGILPKAASSFSPSEYARLRKVVELNGFCFNGASGGNELVEGESGYDIGEVIFPEVSRINHSCLPNLSHNLFLDADGAISVSVRATRAVEAGEELNISYVPRIDLIAVAERRQRLKKNWGFDCGCVRCEAEFEPVPRLVRGSVETTPDGVEDLDLDSVPW